MEEEVDLLNEIWAEPDREEDKHGTNSYTSSTSSNKSTTDSGIILGPSNNSDSTLRTTQSSPSILQHPTNQDSGSKVQTRTRPATAPATPNRMTPTTPKKRKAEDPQQISRDLFNDDDDSDTDDRERDDNDNSRNHEALHDRRNCTNNKKARRSWEKEKSSPSGIDLFSHDLREQPEQSHRNVVTNNNSVNPSPLLFTYNGTSQFQFKLPMENAEQQQGSANNTPRSQSSNTEGGSTQEEQEFMQETQLQPEYQLAFFANYKHDGDDGGPQAVGAGGSTEGDNNTPEVKPSTHVVAMSFDYDQMELTQVTDFLDPDFDADSSKQPSPIKSVVMQTIPPGKQQPKTLSPKQLVSQPQLQPQPQPLPLQIADPIPMPLPIPQPQQQQQQLPIPIPIPLQAQSLPRDINPGLIPQLPQQKQIQSLPNMHPHRIDSQQQQQQPVFKAPQPSIPPLNIIPHPVPKNSFEIDPSALILEPKPFASGGFADVYKGTYKGMQVAVKRLKQSDLSPESLEDFRKEVSILSLLRHENLVGFVGACTIPTHMCMVFEFVESGSLFDALYKDGCVHSSPHNSTSSTGSANSTTGTAAGGAQQQQQPQIVNPQRYRVYKEIRKQPPVLKMRILKQIAAACLYLHTPDQATNKPCVVHRDLKPENVMLDKNLNVKLSDFGLSRTKSQHSSVKTKHIAGTCMYMSPEALDGESVTEKVDVYAYGMIMWEMCSHAPPWTYPKKLSDPQIIAHVLQNKRPPLPKDTNPALAALIQECWHQDPAQRPSFAEILKRLDAMMPT